MKNTFGNQLSVTLFGESHGHEIGAVLDGIAPGISVDEEFIRRRLALRRPAGDGLSTARAEGDPFRIVSGVFEGKTTGTPLCLLIPNGDTHSRDYNRGMARPGHADYTAECKYHGFQDYRGGGHFSGRLTAPLVAVGAILLSALAKKGITVGTHIASLAGIPDRPLSADPTADLNRLNETQFPVLDEAAAGRMKEAIRSAAADGDSVGGILETAAVGMPAGVGEPWFDTVESLLSHALFGIPAVKGVEFGAGRKQTTECAYRTVGCFIQPTATAASAAALRTARRSCSVAWSSQRPPSRGSRRALISERGRTCSWQSRADTIPQSFTARGRLWTA